MKHPYINKTYDQQIKITDENLERIFQKPGEEEKGDDNKKRSVFKNLTSEV